MLLAIVSRAREKLDFTYSIQLGRYGDQLLCTNCLLEIVLLVDGLSYDNTLNLLLQDQGSN